MELDNLILDLAHFDGGEGGGADGGATGEAGAAPDTGVPGEPAPAPDESDAEARKAEYAKFKDQFKDLYGEEVKGHVENRLKKYKTLEQQHTAMNKDVSELLEMYDAKDLSDLKTKAQADRDRQIETEAYEKGMEPDEYKQQMDRDRKARLYEQIEQRESFTQKMMQTWQAQATDLAQKYQDFNLSAVAAEPAAQEMLRQGHTMKATYETVNARQILSGNPEYEGFDFDAWQPTSAFTALLEAGNSIDNAFEATNLDWTKQAAAKKAEKRTVDTIRGGGRPKEMGGDGPKGGARSKNIMDMTGPEAKQAMDDILSGRASPKDYGL